MAVILSFHCSFIIVVCFCKIISWCLTYRIRTFILSIGRPPLINSSPIAKRRHHFNFITNIHDFVPNVFWIWCDGNVAYENLLLCRADEMNSKGIRPAASASIRITNYEIRRLSFMLIEPHSIYYHFTYFANNHNLQSSTLGYVLAATLKTRKLLH